MDELYPAWVDQYPDEVPMQGFGGMSGEETQQMRGILGQVGVPSGYADQPPPSIADILMALANYGGLALPSRGGMGYAEQKFKDSLPVVVKWFDKLEGPQVHHDAVKGLNRGHALYRAKENWPGADVNPIMEVFRRLMQYTR